MSWRQSKSGEVTFSKRVDLGPQSFVFTRHWRHRKGVVAYDRSESRVQSLESWTLDPEFLRSHFQFNSHAHICPPATNSPFSGCIFSAAPISFCSCPSSIDLCPGNALVYPSVLYPCPFWPLSIWLLAPRRLLCFTLTTFVAPFCACPACPIMTTEKFHYPFGIRFVINLIYPQDIGLYGLPMYFLCGSPLSPSRPQHIIGAQSNFWQCCGRG